MAGFFGIFDYTKPGPGVRKDEPEKKGVELYFDIFIRRFWKLVSLNALHTLCSIISLCVLWIVSSNIVRWVVSMAGFDINALSQYEGSVTFKLALCVLVIIAGEFGTGASTAASSYVIRNYVNDNHSWVSSDFFEHIKKNFIQGTITFIIDVVFICVFLTSMLFYTVNVGGAFSVFLRSLLMIVFLIFSMMHMYIYQIMAKFKMKLKDIYKSSAILVLMKLPWNILSFLVSCLITYVLLYVYMTNTVLAMVLTISVYFSINTFTQIFMTNNIVCKYILEPSLEMERKLEKNTSEDK